MPRHVYEPVVRRNDRRRRHGAGALLAAGGLAVALTAPASASVSAPASTPASAQPGPERDPLPAAPPAAAAAAAAPAPYPAAETFRLHSRRGAARVIHLDFDGHAVTGTIWNSQGLSTRPQPAFDLDDTPGRWTQAEHDVIQSAFRSVAEDFAPFDVDVTTEDPGAAALNRSSQADTHYGARVLITPSAEASALACGGGVAGCSQIGAFDLATNGYDQPAWVFTNSYSDAKYVAEVASHEVGHNLGLSHDGTSQADSYGGHGNWAPIMSGSGIWKPVVQWSRGEYADANNREDDIAVMQAHGLPLRADDHGSTPATATAVGGAATASGIIRSRIDSDMFSFTRSCAGRATVTARPAAGSPNLDIKLRVRTTAGALVAENDPPSGVLPDYSAATGLAASVTVALQPGTYVAEVDGVGVRTPVTGYSDYGSRGQYTLAFSGCAPVPTAQLLLSPGELRGVAGGGWATRLEDLTPKATVEPLASCSGTAMLSPSVNRTFTALPGRAVDQRVVRYQPGKGDAVVDLFRSVLRQCPVRPTASGAQERWSVLADTAGTANDTLIVRRSSSSTGSQVSYRVVVRGGDAVSVLAYAPNAGAAGDDAGARALGTAAAAKLGTSG